MLNANSDSSADTSLSLCEGPENPYPLYRRLRK